MIKKKSESTSPCHEDYFKAHDNHRLYYQIWSTPSPKAVLIFVHGLNEHCGRYSFPIRYFHKKDYTLYLFDHRGHGKSDGVRSFVDSFKHYLEDLNEFVQMVVKREKGKPVFMVGHSMGGQILINYLAQFSPKITGFLTSSANIEVALKLPWIKKVVGMNAARIFPKLTVTNEIDSKWICRDEKVVDEYNRDHLVSRKITLKLASEILTNQEDILDMAPQIKLPAFMMHGGADRICSPDGTRKFFRLLGSRVKEMKVYEGMYHEIFNEIGKEQVFKDMDNWIEKRLS